MSREPKEPLTESGTSYCWLGPYNAHAYNYERTECIFCGPSKLSLKPGRWVPLGDGMAAWSVEPEEVSHAGVGEVPAAEPT